MRILYVTIVCGIFLTACSTAQPPTTTPTAILTVTPALNRTAETIETATQSAQYILQASETSKAHQTVLALTPSRTPWPTRTPRPTLNPALFIGLWKTYRNEKFGFSFEYPAIYDESPYNCGPKTVGAGIFTVGYRINLLTQHDPAANIEATADTFVAARVEPDRVEQRVTGHIGGEKAVTVDYRFGGTNRFGTVTFVSHNGWLYTFNWTAGGWCDIPESETREYDVYYHMLETFSFLN